MSLFLELTMDAALTNQITSLKEARAFIGWHKLHCHPRLPEYQLHARQE